MTLLPPPLVPKQIELAMRDVTLALLGFSPPYDKTVYSKVRPGWQQQGQPSNSIDEDVVYLRAYEDDDPTNRQRDVEYEDDADPDLVNEFHTFQRVWRVVWCFYGPNSFDSARKVRSGFYSQVPHDILATKNLALFTVMELEAPRRVPEYFQQQWWERVDFEAQFNEQVTEQVQVGRVKSTEVLLYTSDSADIDHPDRDIVVEAGN